jgi:hypothetical protein
MADVCVEVEALQTTTYDGVLDSLVKCEDYSSLASALEDSLNQTVDAACQSYYALCQPSGTCNTCGISTLDTLPDTVGSSSSASAALRD